MSHGLRQVGKVPLCNRLPCHGRHLLRLEIALNSNGWPLAVNAGNVGRGSSI